MMNYSSICKKKMCGNSLNVVAYLHRIKRPLWRNAHMRTHTSFTSLDSTTSIIAHVDPQYSIQCNSCPLWCYLLPMKINSWRIYHLMNNTTIVGYMCDKWFTNFICSWKNGKKSESCYVILSRSIQPIAIEKWIKQYGLMLFGSRNFSGLQWWQAWSGQMPYT